MTNAIAAFGAVLQVGDGATPENFTDIPELRDIVGPALSSDVADVTNHGSPAGMEEAVPTILRTGDVTFTVGYVPTGAVHDQLLADWKAKSLRNFKLIYADAGTTEWPFAAYVTGFTPNNPVGGDITANLTLKITGEIVFP